MESHADDDADRGKLLTHPPELSDNPTSRGISKRNGRNGRSENFVYQ
jgi:hypothetical protein